MIETQLSLFDAVVLGVLVISCVFAFFRGFVREILSLGAWVGAAMVTLYYFPDVAEELRPHFKTPVVAAGFATLGLYIGALMVFSLINMLILKLLKSGDEVGPTDNILGLAFGAARGVFIIALGYFILAMMLPSNENPDWLEKSVTLPYVEKSALWLAKLAPDYLNDMAELEKKMRTQEMPVDEVGAYSKAAQTKLDKLLEGEDEK
jgi:membrane protein required for colicin V production